MNTTVLRPTGWDEVAAMKELRGGDVHITSFTAGLFRGGIKKISVKKHFVVITFTWAAQYENGYWLGVKGLFELNFAANYHREGVYERKRIRFSLQQHQPPNRDQRGVITCITQEYGLLLIQPKGFARPLNSYDLV